MRDLAFKASSTSHNMIGLLNKWELPGLIVLSLVFQFALAIFGTKRRYRGSILFSTAQWLADWIANVALTVILKGETTEHSRDIILLWTPFLLLHLGGSDSIGSDSSDDVLWKKYLLGLCIQLGVAVYVYIRFRTNSILKYIAIPIFISGMIKYGERIWVLRAASKLKHGDFIFSSPSRRAATTKHNGLTCNHLPQTLDAYLAEKKVIEGGKSVHRAFCLFKLFLPVFSDFNLRIYKELSNILLSPFHSVEDAFKLVHIELGFLYDVLYTETNILQSIVGIILQSMCLLSTFVALIAFSIAAHKSGYPREEISITYMLLGGAILLDICSAISQAFSTWTILWLTSPTNLVNKCGGQRIVSWLVRRNAKKKRMVSMAQHSIIDYCLKVKISKWTAILRVIDTEYILGKFRYTSWEQVNWDLKNFIYSHLQKKFKRYQNINDNATKFDYDLLLVNIKGEGGTSA